VSLLRYLPHSNTTTAAAMPVWGTRPQTEWKAGERRRDTSPTISWAAWKGPSLRLVWVLVWDARWRLEVGSLLPPSSGSTQGGTTPGVSFCVRLDPDGAATERLVALHPLDLWNGEA
jgi:hypothetical protein